MESMRNYLIKKHSKMIIYRGSNPEYIAFHPNGQLLSFLEYRTVVLPRLKSIFPPVNPGNVTVGHEGSHSELQEITASLNKSKFTICAIPKTLYDLFYLYFFFADAYNKRHPLECVAIRNFYVDEEDIYNKFNKREEDIHQKKIDWLLNNKIIALFKEKNILPNELYWKDIKKMAIFILKSIVLYNAKFTNAWYLTYILDRLKLPGKFEQFKKIILDSLSHEFYLDPDFYTLYRTSTPERNRVVHYGETPYSLSLGHSPLAALEYDGTSGSVLGIFLYKETPIFTLDIKKSDYLNPSSMASNLLFIPPARRTMRMAIHGEFGHARGKVLADGSKYIDGIAGTARATLSQKSGGHPVLIQQGFFKDKKEFKQQANEFFSKNLTLLKSKRPRESDQIVEPCLMQKRLCISS